jgi:hypothetical protein
MVIHYVFLTISSDFLFNSLIKIILTRFTLIKLDTLCPFNPWPSHTQNNLILWGSLFSIIIASWLIFVCLPVLPAFVLE